MLVIECSIGIDIIFMTVTVGGLSRYSNVQYFTGMPTRRTVSVEFKAFYFIVLNLVRNSPPSQQCGILFKLTLYFY